MKKTILILIFGLIIVPQITFAAWWNPFTWNMFNKPIRTTETTHSIASSTPVNGDQSPQRREVNNPGINQIENLAKKDNSKKAPVSTGWVLTEKEFKTKMLDLIKQGIYTKDDINIWLGIFHRNSDGTYTNTVDTAHGIYSNIDQKLIKSWLTEIPDKTLVQQEAGWFAEAEKKGWNAFIYTFSNGEKSYYKKENGKWTKKNNEAELTVSNSQTNGDLTDEQKVKLTISAKEVLDSFDSSINLEKRVTNEYIAIYDQKSSVSNEVLSHCEQGKITDQSLMESQKQRFLHQMASRGQLDGWSDANQLIAEEEARGKQYVDNNYRQCVLITQSLNVPRISYKTELQDWLNRLDTFNEMSSSLRSGLNDGVTSVAEMQDLKQGFEVLNTSFSRERTSIDSLRRTIAQSSPVNYDLQRQLQDSIDRTKKELENPFGYTDITCKPGITSSYECSSLRGSSPFSCNVNQYGYVTCSTRTIR